MDFFFLFFMGSILGSFLNVCIYRLPENLSIVKPRSFCPSCKQPIKAWQNIPILSYLLLKGKCGNCGKKISIQYPLVEMISGIVTVLAYYHFSLNPQFFIYLVFIYFLIVIAFVDYKTQLIYNKVLLLLLIYGIAGELVFRFINLQDALFGILAGGGSMFLISLLGKAMFKKDALGMGDIKMAAVAGFYVGWLNILIALYVGFVLAFLVMVIRSIIKKTKLQGRIPLGPFLALGLVVFLFWGKQIVGFYLSIVIG